MRELRLIDPRWRARYSHQRLGEFVARCHERRSAVTPQRLAVIRALLASENHPSADEICAAVRREHPHVTLATVHRILEQFCEVGEARKVTLLHDAARYDGNVEPHHHVLCVRCRRVHDIEIPEVNKLLEGTPSLGQFALLRCSLEIEALCGQCQLAEKRAPARHSRHAGPGPLGKSGPKRKGRWASDARELKPGGQQ
jgi:Fur family peroxide stress response transcriptional regulator